MDGAIMVEYLEPSMSEHLLCKFPDDSAFGFDYSQSAIWSPLLPRGLCGPCSSYQDKRPREPRNRKRKAKQGSFKKRLEFSPTLPQKEQQTGMEWIVQSCCNSVQISSFPFVEEALADSLGFKLEGTWPKSLI
ncbi:hypothetical protein HPP92_015476 [Vanilla planifolia]|uniref:Uncharacterized protein n=1 Tax=Vanilla planifolia TaxID=51239 RepID=A0A835QLX3_VANPL|nr:hypothetical protein HPP92_015476 [Vanilla planifolia]